MVQLPDGAEREIEHFELSEENMAGAILPIHRDQLDTRITGYSLTAHVHLAGAPRPTIPLLWSRGGNDASGEILTNCTGYVRGNNGTGEIPAFQSSTPNDAMRIGSAWLGAAQLGDIQHGEVQPAYCLCNEHDLGDDVNAGDIAIFHCVPSDGLLMVNETEEKAWDSKRLNAEEDQMANESEKTT